MEILVRIWQRIEKVLKEDFLTILFVTFFNILPFRLYVFYISAFNEKNSIKVFKSFFRISEFFIIILLIYIILSFFNKKIKKIISNFLLMVSTILFLTELFLLYTFSMNISSLAIQILFDTNKNEIVEFLKTYINFKYVVVCFLFLCILKMVYGKVKNIFLNILEHIFKIKILKPFLILLIFF